jgi:hypothetical protein
MKRGRLKKSSVAKCDHKFIDSKSCLKCGWTPTGEDFAALEIGRAHVPVPPFSFRVTEHEVTRLRVGDVIEYGETHAEHIVIKVNGSCARIVPFGAPSTKKVVFTPRFSEKPVEFNAPVRTDPIAISPNSECEIVCRLGVNWKERIKD